MTNEEFNNAISVICEDYFQSNNSKPTFLLVPKNWNYDYPVDDLILVRDEELCEGELVVY